MAQEAKGKNGRILGSLNYFSLLNEKFPQKSLIKDKTKGNYFYMLGNSANKIKQVLSIPVIGAKIKEFLQGIVNTISNDIEAAAKSGCYATYENRKKLKECLDQLKKFNFTVPNSAYDSIKKLRRLEDFHNKIIELNFKGEQYPVEVWLEWTGGKNILHIHPKIIFYEDFSNKKYNNSDYTKMDLVIKGFNKWSGNYKVFNSAEEGKQDLQVICKATEQSLDDTIGIYVHLKIDSEMGRSKTKLPESNIWSQKEPLSKMDLYTQELAGSPYTPEYYAEVAKHELGHVLGIKDAYSDNRKHSDMPQYYSQYNDIQEDITEKGVNLTDEDGLFNMAMFNASGPIINNDIEMLILAWQSGKMQYFHLYSYGTEISEALGR